MRTTSWTDEHSQAISAAAPPVPAVSPVELDRTWAAIQESMAAAGPSRHRRTRVLVGAAIALATLMVSGVAVAAVLSAHTGRYPSDAESIRLGGPGEYLDHAAPDYGTVIDEETTDIPFPNDEAREISRQGLVRDGQLDDPGTGSVSTGAMRFWTAQGAICAWSNEWAAATTAGNASARARATRMLDDASNWPAVTDVDPDQTIRYEEHEVIDEETGKTTTETVPNNTEAGYLPLVQKAAHGDDVDALGSVLVRWVYCAPALMPDLPQALPGQR